MPGGVVTPFAEASLANDGTRLRAGARCSLIPARSAGSLDLELSGERRDAPGAAPVHTLRLDLNLRF